MRNFATTTLPICVVLLCVGTWMLNAGDLTPPSGPISPTGRFGPRIDINSLAGDADSVHRITQRGSYYLSGNVSVPGGFHGIQIAADMVTIDLNGFRIEGEGGSLNGIDSDFSLISIANGIVFGMGENGIRLGGLTGMMKDLMVRNCGGDGFDTSNDVVIERCQSNNNGGEGFDLGAGVSLKNCTARGNGGDGIQIATYSVVTNCQSVNNAGIGISAGGENLIRGNLARLNGIAQTTPGLSVISTLIDNRF